MNVDIDSIPNAIEVRLSLPRPDWETIAAWISDNVDESDLDQAYKQVARQWLEKLQSFLPEGYTIAESDEFYLLSREDARTTERLLDWCEAFRESILHLMDGTADEVGYGIQVLLAFHDLDTYYGYIADFYPEDGAFAPSGGVFLDAGYGHIATCGVHHQLDRTIAHELTHALIRHLPLPPWLNEGVTQLMEDIVTESSGFTIDRELARRHRAYWTPERLDAFWSGESFEYPDEGQELSYNLAQVLLRNLFSDFSKKTFDFVRTANYYDAGDSAARETLGVGLADRAAQFLGPGNWQPRANYGAPEAEQDLNSDDPALYRAADR